MKAIRLIVGNFKSCWQRRVLAVTVPVFRWVCQVKQRYSQYTEMKDVAVWQVPGRRSLWADTSVKRRSF